MNLVRLVRLSSFSTQQEIHFYTLFQRWATKFVRIHIVPLIVPSGPQIAQKDHVNATKIDYVAPSCIISYIFSLTANTDFYYSKFDGFLFQV